MEKVELKPGLQAYAGILASATIASRYGFKPMGCSVSDRGVACDFESGGKYPSIEEIQKLLEKLAGNSIQCRDSAEGVWLELGRTRLCSINGVEVPLDPGVDPEPTDEIYIHVFNVSSHNPREDWRLLRINMAGFPDPESREAFLAWYREAEKRDHRILGRKLDLFSFHDAAGPGLVLYHPRGQIVREELIRLVREINERLGYREVYTPHVYRSLLWRISGHIQHYRDKMILAKVEGDEYGVKPMNCPGHILIYKTLPRSYRDLPIKYSEFGTVYRWEKRGELYGLLRVRGFTQDDGHAFLREDQVKDEVKAILKELLWMLGLFGFHGEDIKISLSTRPEDYIGTPEAWDKATQALRDALDELGLDYEVKEGEGAFYGPKIDVDFRDSLGRWWQCGTIQVDFNLPERFGLEYTDRDGTKKRPVMVHRALLGSVERFMAILIENFAGRLPTWLSPIQVAVVPVSKKHLGYAEEIAGELRARGVRVEVRGGSESLSKRVREAYADAIPYILVVGGREMENRSVTVRARGNVTVRNVPLEKFIELLQEEIGERSLAQTVVEKLSQMD